MEKNHEYFMNIALKEAQKAFLLNEVPIGCVIVKDNKILAKAHNLRETKKDPCGHAEILAIRKASKKLGDWQLIDCNIYITVEPCIMCAGTIIQSRIAGIFYGADNFKGGALGSSINVLEADNINHHPTVEKGILEKECSKLLKDFFKMNRKGKNCN